MKDGNMGKGNNYKDSKANQNGNMNKGPISEKNMNASRNEKFGRKEEARADSIRNESKDQGRQDKNLGQNEPGKQNYPNTGKNEKYPPKNIQQDKRKAG